MVITGVADEIPERIRTLVYLDALIPNNLESMCDILGPVRTEEMVHLAQESGHGWLVPITHLDVAADFGVTDAADAAWVAAHLTPHPLRAYSAQIRLTGAIDRVPNKIIVRCTEHKNRPHLDRALVLFGGRPGWTGLSAERCFWPNTPT